MIAAENTALLELQNENNQFACDYFIKINVAPPHPSAKNNYQVAIPDSALHKIFKVPHQGSYFFVQLVDYTRVQMSRLNEGDCLVASGKSKIDFQFDFLQSNKSLGADPEMAVYIYKKVKGD